MNEHNRNVSKIGSNLLIHKRTKVFMYFNLSQNVLRIKILFPQSQFLNYRCICCFSIFYVAVDTIIRHNTQVVIILNLLQSYLLKYGYITADQASLSSMAIIKEGIKRFQDMAGLPETGTYLCLTLITES